MAEHNTAPTPAETPQLGEAPQLRGHFTHNEITYQEIGTGGTGMSVFEQLRRSAEEQGKPDMVGLEWLESDGMRYRVTSYEQLTEMSRATTKTRLPRLSKHKTLGPQLGKKESVTGGRKRKPVDYRTVDVINEDGDIVDVLEFTGSRREAVPRLVPFPSYVEGSAGLLGTPKEYRDVDEFEGHFEVSAHPNPNSLASIEKKDRDVVGFRWTEQAGEAAGVPDPANTVRVAAPRIPDQEPGELKPKDPKTKVRMLFEALAVQHAQDDALGATKGWPGLTWNSAFMLKDSHGEWSPGNVQMQIVRDTMILRKESPQAVPYLDRVFEVVSRLQDGTVVDNRLYTFDELQKFFIQKEQSDREMREVGRRPVNLSMRWEIPEGTPGTPPFEEGEGTSISMDEAFRLLAAPELYPPGAHGQAALEAHIIKMREDEESLEWATALQRVVERVGIERFTEVIGELHAEYTEDLRHVGVAIHPEDDSISTTIRQALAVGALEAQDRLLFKDTAEARQLRSWFASLELGMRFHEAVFELVRGETEVWDEKLQENVKKPAVQRIENRDIMWHIRKLLYIEQINKTLGRDINNHDEKSEFQVPDLVELGHLLRMSLGRD